jgi:hypothetical protein
MQHGKSFLSKIVAGTGKSVPLLLGLLFLSSGLFKLFRPMQATLALESLEIRYDLAKSVIAAITVIELYLGIILLLRMSRRWALSLSTAMMLVFTIFVFYLSLLAHPPSCGCLMLTGLFESTRDDARFGVLRNCLILWGLKISWNYHFGQKKSVSVGNGLGTTTPTVPA